MSSLRGQSEMSRGRRLLVIGGLISLLIVILIVWLRDGDDVRSEQLTKRAELLVSTGDFESALNLARQAFQLDPTNAQAVLLAAQSTAAMGDAAAAVAWCDRLPDLQSEHALPTWHLKARLLHNNLFNFKAAEATYLQILTITPDDREANTGLARLLATCARRRDAAPHILRLIRQRAVTDLIIVLSQQSAIISDPGALQRAHSAFPDDPYPLIGMAWHDAESGETDRAIANLQAAVKLSPPGCLAARMALGPLLWKHADRDRCRQWLADLPDSANDHPEPWLVRAQLAEASGKPDTAIRCYWETVRLAPESRVPVSRLAHLLARKGLSKQAQQFASVAAAQQKLQTLQSRVMNQGGFATPQEALTLVSGYERHGRLYEACGWCRLASSSFVGSSKLRQTLKRLEGEVSKAPQLQVQREANVALAVDLSNFPLPDDRPTDVRTEQQESSAESPTSDSVQRVTFREESKARGMQFRFFNGAEVTPTGKMFELTGGGVSVLDFDHDGWPDVFLTQGRSQSPVVSTRDLSDCIFRNVSGDRFHNVTAEAGINDTHFGQGASAGDINADGFTDLYVANLDENLLWLNNGDGTFTLIPLVQENGPHAWTTSCAIADIDGDTLPDLIDVNYLDGDDVFERVCPDRSGQPHQCLPFHFDAAADRILRNLGDGQFKSDATALSEVEPGKGLGLAVWYCESTTEARILVANDTTPNQLLIPEHDAETGMLFRDLGFGSGIALNEDGKSEGCMGIAVADLNGDGLHEFLVTNFLAETNTLYWQSSPDSFEDRTRDLHLNVASNDVLGFGTQFLDADLDGLAELFVANGHVDDLRDSGKPFRMPPQMFRWDGRRFALGDSLIQGPYFQTDWLGRAAARIDWNRDGLNDLVVAHLDDEYALLTNTTSPFGNFISLKLIGVESNRDAIGATVRVRSLQRVQFQQITAGDGYQCSNERQLTFGLGDASEAQSVEVVWPSGRRQRFESIPTSRRYLLLEGSELITDP